MEQSRPVAVESILKYGVNNTGRFQGTTGALNRRPQPARMNTAHHRIGGPPEEKRATGFQSSRGNPTGQHTSRLSHPPLIKTK